MSAIEDLISEFEDMCGESGTEMGNDAAAELKAFLTLADIVVRCGLQHDADCAKTINVSEDCDCGAEIADQLARNTLKGVK